MAEAGAPAYDAIVIGAGPAGGTAALLLARAGWSVALVEKCTFPRRKLCGEYVSATNLPVLRDLGLGDAFADRQGPEVQRAALFAGEVELVFPMPKTCSAVGHSWGHAISRAYLDLMLLCAAARAGATLWQPYSVTGLRRAANGWTCNLAGCEGTQDISAPIVIAANGSWERSPVPVQLGGKHRPDDLLAFKGHFLDCDMPADLMPLLVFPGGYGGMVHSGSGGVNLSCCIRRDVFIECRSATGTRAGEAVRRHIEAHCTGVRHVMRCAHLESAWLAAGPINPGIRKPAEEGLFFVGNLAGEAHPIVAEGISMAIQSSWILCRRLIARQDDLADERALTVTGKEYAAEWRSCFAGRLRAAGYFAHLALNTYAVATLVPALGRFPALLTLGAGLSGKTKEMDTTV